MIMNLRKPSRRTNDGSLLNGRFGKRWRLPFHSFFTFLPITEIFRVLPWIMAFADSLKFPRITVDDGSYFYITIVVTEAKKKFIDATVHQAQRPVESSLAKHDLPFHLQKSQRATHCGQKN